MATRSNRRDEGGNNEDKKNRFTAEEKGKGIMPSKPSKEESEEEEELPLSWDWRDYPGVIGPVMNQKLLAICWAIALVRAVTALLNINLPQENQIIELSIQHLVNKVDYNEGDGIQNMKRAFSFAKDEGICTSSQCTPNTRDNNVAKKLVCQHPENIHTIKVDEFEYFTDVNDEELLAIVRQQPVIGILRNTNNEFTNIGSNIYRSPGGPVDISFHQVLIIGYGYDSKGKPYWIIQNSYGEEWGNGGFGYVYRRIKRGQGSEFFAVAYPKIRGYPRKPR